MIRVVGDPAANTGIWRVLDNPAVWEARRISLEILTRLYRQRVTALTEWGLAGKKLSVLDIGCGTGQYSGITEGPYLGVDLNERYVRRAQQRGNHPNKTFRCADAMSLLDESQTFDLVLMVDFLHHMSDEQCGQLMRAAGRLGRNVVIFDQIAEQPNPVARWLVAHDRGQYVRPFGRLQALIEDAQLTIIETRSIPFGPIRTVGILARPQRAGNEGSAPRD